MGITITLPTELVELCTDMGLMADHERAVRALEEAQKRGAGMENSGVPEAARAVEDVERRMEESTLEFTLQALPKKRFQEWVAAHPAREGDQLDESLSVNVADLDDLISQCVVGVRKPDGTPIDFESNDWPELADQITDGQWQEFALATLRANRGAGTKRPFSRAASLVTRRSEQS